VATIRGEDVEARVGYGNVARTLARVFGIAFLLVGIAGFIPGLTSNFDDIKFAGDGSDAEIFGLFQTSILHNIVHLLFGVAGLVMSRRWDRASNYLLGSGLIYVLLVVYGLFVGKDDTGGENFIPLNNEDDVLHGVLALGLLGAWALTRRERRASGEPAAVRDTSRR
jgi:uncharacterized membrane protein YuzA (DUF378 family)